VPPAMSYYQRADANRKQLSSNGRRKVNKREREKKNKMQQR
jgi:hypothetical protein